MKASEALRKYIQEEEFQVEVEEEIDYTSLGELQEVPLETRILVRCKGRARLVFLGFLKIAFECSPEFAKDYLNMGISLEEVKRRHGVYTDLEFVALHCLHMVKDRDAQAALQRLKTYILSRESKGHGL